MSPIAICYYGNYFSFYTAITGQRTFEVSDKTTKTDKNGHVVEDFLNAESALNMHGDYNVQIVYGITKTILINFTRFGQAYIITSKNFLGSPETNQLTKGIVSRLRTGKYKKATTLYPVQEWFDKHFKADTAISKTDSGQVTCEVSIGKRGEILNVRVIQKIVSISERDEIFDSSVVSCFKDMPNWQAAVDESGQYTQCQFDVVVKI